MADQYVQVQPDSNGKKVDTSEVTVGANVVERQRINLADPVIAAAIAAIQNAQPLGTEYGLVTRPVQGDYPAYRRQAANRSDRGRILFVEDARNPTLGMWNDAVGVAYRDSEITFAGMPTVRLDPQGSIASGNGAGQPGTLDTNGVIFKRRIQDSYSGRFAVEFWLRFTHSNIQSNGSNWVTCSLYNRNGTNAWHSRLWFDTSGGLTSTAIRYLASDNTWPILDTVTDQGNATHTYSIPGNLNDKAGQWNYVKLCTDLNTKNYVYAQWNNHFYDMAGIPVQTQSSSSQAVMHFSVECASSGGLSKYINIAQVVGTRES